MMKKIDDYRYKIIEPFLKKEKKLKEIESETNVSYATLKRWVTQYKTSGLSGLKKKNRVDKDTSKKINNEALIKIKEIYKEEYDLPITQIYEKAKKIMINYNSMVSYSTFFRIINNLDKNIKESSLGSIKVENIFEYGIIQKGVLIPFFNDENKVFYLTVFYNKNTYEVINFIFEEIERSFEKLFNFIYESILIEGVYPKNISVDLKINGVSKKLEKSIFFETGINIIQEEYIEEKDKFLTFVGLDILKEFNRKKPKTINEIILFLDKYFFIEEENIYKKNSIEKDEMEKIKIFLSKYKRKVYPMGIRVKNNMYDSKILRDYEDKIIEAIYNEFNKKEIKVYYKDKYIGEAHLK
ncbi:Mu transposase C-terminal domain-containing protein [uncultured Cetobacterium sp.]|uniref:Mu transposase C-terminal domain-containing protein n=1 Tax=uncultured Cetobacterium sp. TaxID=527638 RepID=UPI0026399257|nr:Mu transposase C-terminal domain-containing protein [uncultured Cetobacterium sp.]